MHGSSWRTYNQAFNVVVLQRLYHACTGMGLTIADTWDRADVIKHGLTQQSGRHTVGSRQAVKANKQTNPTDKQSQLIQNGKSCLSISWIRTGTSRKPNGESCYRYKVSHMILCELPSVNYSLCMREVRSDGSQLKRQGQAWVWEVNSAEVTSRQVRHGSRWLNRKTKTNQKNHRG